MISNARLSLAIFAVAMLCGVGSDRSALAEDHATIKGKVSYTGEPKKRRPIPLNADPNCVKFHAGGKGIGTEDVIVNKESQTLQNVIVSVKDGLGDKKYDPPGVPVVLDQVGCQYQPHIVALMKDQKLVVRNSDNTLHNVNMLARRNPPQNIGQPKKGLEKELDFQQEETFLVKCDVHPWMNAHIAVFLHPFFDVTDKQREGAFALSDLPAGEYTIQAWHEELGTLEQKVTVADGETKEIEFVYEMK